MNLPEIAKQLKETGENIILIYAFNSVGKTRLSVAYKDLTKAENGGNHAGVYYNAYSEDLFKWNNDEENGGENIRLEVKNSSLNVFYNILSIDDVTEKLIPFSVNYKFEFNLNKDQEVYLDSISFYVIEKDENDKEFKKYIKISRGQERIFVWCFFLTLFDKAEGWSGEQDKHFFIDDPVSSLDDHNIFITASTIYALIEKQSRDRKIILTTHHFGLFSILDNWLTRGGETSKYKNDTIKYILTQTENQFSLDEQKKSVFLYHLKLLQLLEEAKKADKIYIFHFAVLRQVLENISSFLGKGHFGSVLGRIEMPDANKVADIINALSHQKIFYYQPGFPSQYEVELLKEVFEKLMVKYKFELHTD